MGFRSTFTTEDCGVDWPEWFVEKYKSLLHFNIWKDGKYGGTLSPKHELKYWDGIPEDIQKAIVWSDYRMPNYIMVILHECGGLTRCEITENQINYSEPDGWNNTNGSTHSYCYGCSDTEHNLVESFNRAVLRKPEPEDTNIHPPPNPIHKARSDVRWQEAYRAAKTQFKKIVKNEGKISK